MSGVNCKKLLLEPKGIESLQVNSDEKDEEEEECVEDDNYNIYAVDRSRWVFKVRTKGKKGGGVEKNSDNKVSESNSYIFKQVQRDLETAW